MPSYVKTNSGVVLAVGGRANTLVIPPSYITLTHFDSSVTTRFITPGTVTAYTAASVPTNFLNCDGSVVSQTTFANLFAVIGTTYNTGGEGVGNFRLPDLRGRSPMGQGTGANLTARTMATPTGTENVAVSVGQFPSHTHNLSANSSGSSSDHSHGWTHWNNNQTNNGGGAVNQLSSPAVQAVYTSGGVNQNHNHGVSGTTDNGTGSNQGHQNMMPSLVLRYCIRF